MDNQEQPTETNPANEYDLFQITMPIIGAFLFAVAILAATNHFFIK